MKIRSGSKLKLGVASNSSLLAVALITGGVTPAALAADYQWGEVTARTTASVSVGSTFRTESMHDDLAGQAGNRNFKTGEPVSTVLKGVADIDLQYRNYGLFLRGNAWYDYELKKGDRPNDGAGNFPNGYEPGKPLSDSGLPSEQKFSGVQLLDAYVYGEWDLGDMPVSARAGRQALAWGESMFLGGGVNIINPYDVAAMRRAGSELKEALLPVGMVSSSLALTDNLNLQAFYQYEWEATRLDQCGTFFSAFDGIQEGCMEMDLGLGMPLSGNFDKPEDSGQYGVAAHYYSMPLNTEFGAYYINYHSRNPIIDVDYPTLTYDIIFPEDIEVYGLSAATTLMGKTVYGELAYRPDQPVQFGDLVGYENFENWNLILGTIFNIPQFMGSDELSISAEAGYTRTQGLPEDGTFGNTTKDAMGYRLMFSMPFTDVFMGVNITPSLGINHDVDGTSANGDFVDDRLTATLGAKFEYLKRYTLDMNYTVNTGGKDEGPGGSIKNTMHDRDFFGVSLSMDF